MKKYFILIFIPAIFIFRFSHAYYPKQGNIWYFGDYAGIDFNSTPPVPLINGALYTYDNSSAISDVSGNLLFYSNGVTVWNKTHQVMNNGSGLLGNQSGGQSALIIPQPENSEYYYLFTTSEFGAGAGFCYNKISMSQPAGLGSVIIKNQVLISPATEKIACIYNFSQNFWWVVAHEFGNNHFKAYKLNSSGLDINPVVSAVGTVHSGGTYGYSHNAVGQMNISPHGNKIAVGLFLSGLYEVLDFDINTGAISNPITLPGSSTAFGVDFSPNSKKLYISQLYDPIVYQYDLTAGNQTAIQNSKTAIGSIPSTGSYRGGYMSLAPDGRIYIANYGGSSLAVIDQPDQQPTLVNFIGNGFGLGGKASLAGVCTNIYKQAHLVSGIYEDIFSDIKIYPNPTSDIFHISVESNKFIPENITVYNSTSQVLSTQIYNVMSSRTINLKDHPAGVYFVRLSSESTQKTFKVIKE